MAAKAMLYALRSKKIGLLSYEAEEHRYLFDLISRVKKETGMLQEMHEAFQLYQAVRSTANIPGDMAEVGVYRGGSAMLICEAKKDKTLHLFDTFTGIPEVTEEDSAYFYQGQLAASLTAVEQRLKPYNNVCIYPGVFPQTAGTLKDKKFSFVHLDADTYRSTLACLHFFYPRMAAGGMIITHDYTTSDGVKKAYHEFFASRPEAVIALLGTQGLMVKLS